MIITLVLACMYVYATCMQLPDVQYTCISDIKECSIGTHNCSQLCIELDGGYRCGCYDGYDLEKDGITCKGIKPHPNTVQLNFSLMLACTILGCCPLLFMCYSRIAHMSFCTQLK